MFLFPPSPTSGAAAPKTSRFMLGGYRSLQTHLLGVCRSPDPLAQINKNICQRLTTTASLAPDRMNLYALRHPRPKNK